MEDTYEGGYTIHHILGKMRAMVVKKCDGFSGLEEAGLYSSGHYFGQGSNIGGYPLGLKVDCGDSCELVVEIVVSR